MTRGEINRLGEKIAEQGLNNLDQESLEKLQEYRTTFKNPLALVFNHLRKEAKKIDNKAIVTYRIKRIESIVNKLVRFKDSPNGRMSLSSMGDIAGCRCIFNGDETDKVYKLKSIIEKIFPRNTSTKDYIIVPKIDGYISLHMYVVDLISNKKVEIQIRTTQHHNWATLVEIIDLIYNKKIKEGGRDGELKDFLLLFSKRADLSIKEKNKIVCIEREYKIFKRMSDIFSNNYLNVRDQWIHLNKANSYSYYVIEAKKDFTSQIDAYRDFDTAEEEYYNKYVANRSSNIVLTFIPKAKYTDISRAYSNYILTVHSFFDEYKKLLEEQVIQNVKDRDFFSFIRSFLRYKKVVLIYLFDLQREMFTLQQSISDKSVRKIKKDEWLSDLETQLQKWNYTIKIFHKKLKDAKIKNFYLAFLRFEFYRMNLSLKRHKVR